MSSRRGDDRADVAVATAFIVIGVIALGVGTRESVPLLLLVGVISVIYGWAKFHRRIEPPIRDAMKRFVDRPYAPWVALTLVGGALLAWTVLSEGLLAFQFVATVLGVWIGVKGVTRLGLAIRRELAECRSKLKCRSKLIGLARLLSAVLLVLAVLVLVDLGMSILVAFLAVLVLSTAVVLLVIFGRGPVLVGTSLALSIWLTVWLFGYADDSAPIDPHPNSSQVLVAMGDSFMSGEGAAKYFEGTNRESENECRRTSSAYPYLVAAATGRSLVFLACSGATTANVTRTEQFPGIGRQITALRSVSQNLGPGSAVLISIGGNDAGFGEIGRTCLAPGSCEMLGEQWLRNIRGRVEAAILSAHRQVRGAVPEEVPVFAVTYPLVLTEDACRWSPLSREEHQFLANELTVEINEAVRLAASAAGVELIDLERSLGDANVRICDRLDPENSAINLFGIGPVDGPWFVRINPMRWFHSSIHPNEEGHVIFARLVASALNRETLGGGDPGSSDESAEGGFDVGRRGRTLPRVGEDEKAIVALEEPRTNDAPECENLPPREGLLTVFIEATDPEATGIQRIWGAKPNSMACYRDNGGVWHSSEVGDDGVLEVPWGFPTIRDPIEAAYLKADDRAIAVEFVFCTITPTRCPDSGTSDWVVEQVLLLIVVLALAWALLTLGADLGVGAVGLLEDKVLKGPSSQPLRQSTKE